MAQLDFNAYNVEPMSSDFEPLPVGKYKVVITDSRMKDNANRDGSHLDLTFVVIDGKYAKRKLWTCLNLANANPQTVKIANGHLSAICHAVNVMTPVDSEELHNIPLVVTVTQKPRDDGKGMSNPITAYESVAAAETSSPATAPAAPQAANAAPGSPNAAPQTAPWQR